MTHCSPHSAAPGKKRFPTAPEGAAWLRRIGVASTGRADAGIYLPLLRALAAERDWQVTCFAGGTHHDAAFGRTVDELTGLRRVSVVSVRHHVPGDTAAKVSASAGRAVAAFGRAFADHPVDLLFVLGDRTEMLAAALAATIHRLPLAHLHGGDTTLGAYDDACRAAITMLSHVHFPALPRHAERIVAMGEMPRRVCAVGALALDDLAGFRPMSAEKLGRSLGVDLRRPTLLVVFHPETMSDLPAGRQVEELLAALDRVDANGVLVGPNADVGHGDIIAALKRFSARRSGMVLSPALDRRRFWSCCAHAGALVGNSSAGLLEAASFKLPVVNVGERQAGRVRPANVIDAPFERAAIAAAIEKALSASFRRRLRGLVNPYGRGDTAPRIVAALRSLPDRRTLLEKRR